LFSGNKLLQSREFCSLSRPVISSRVCKTDVIANVPADHISEGEDNTGTISEQMVRSVEHYPAETIVAVNAKLRKAPKRVKNATIHDYELEVYEVHKIGDLSEHVPFTVYDAENINRDKEDVDDEEEESSLSSLYPTGENSPKESPKTTPRQSTDLSRISGDQTRNSQDKLASRSKSIIH
jgi:hypothetical protein